MGNSFERAWKKNHTRGAEFAHRVFELGSPLDVHQRAGPTGPASSRLGPRKFSERRTYNSRQFARFGRDRPGVFTHVYDVRQTSDDLQASSRALEGVQREQYFPYVVNHRCTWEGLQYFLCPRKLRRDLNCYQRDSGLIYEDIILAGVSLRK
ncbi:hypothetical protein ARMGADRAFT_523056 [Armillaria gallica]|uniref:Uncharacterized protein n=1 Tax=Armillaria gallica TaxID=47427 RepID=A0A2H3ELH1_ARMGA|nr:hypothetical protein ARMGADRAFT_523056 [Armillaria gallica]